MTASKRSRSTFAPCGHRSQASALGWLQTTETYLSVLEARSPRSRCPGRCSTKSPGDGPPGPFQLLELRRVPGSPGLGPSLLSLPPPSCGRPPVSVPKCPSSLSGSGSS